MQNLRTYQVLNEWQELEEEELSDNGQELMSTYGPFSVILYARLKKLQLFQVPEDPSVFLKTLVQFYTKNAEEMGTKKESMMNVRALVSLFSSSKELKEILSFRQLRGKDRVFFKVALDIMTFYYRIAEAPLFKKLQTEVIPLALHFYSSLDSRALRELLNEPSLFAGARFLTVGKANGKKGWVLLFGEKKEYLAYYRSELVELRNLTGGTNLTTYYA